MPPTADVETPIGDSPCASGRSADQDDTALDRRRRRHQRIVAGLRSLRFGCLLGMVAAAAFYVICGSGVAKVTLKLPLLSWKGLALSAFLWVCGVALWPEPRLGTPSTRSRILTAVRTALMLLPAVLVLASAAYAAIPVARLWRSVLSTYTVNLGEALAYSTGIVAFGLLLSTDILLRASRALFEPYASTSLYESTPISSRLLDLRHELREQPWRSTLRTRSPRALLALVPVVALVVSFTVPYIGPPTASHRPTIAQATGPSMSTAQLPAYPTGFASQETWTKNLASGQDVIAGAAGPIVLTSDGATGLDPRDGSNRWSYQRKGSTAGKVIRSPDGRYMALRFDEPTIYTSLTNTDGELDSSTPKATVVLDTITGATVFDWRGDSTLQMTDSAVLYGTTAYSLKDRSLTAPQALSPLRPPTSARLVTRPSSSVSPRGTTTSSYPRRIPPPRMSFLTSPPGHPLRPPAGRTSTTAPSSSTAGQSSTNPAGNRSNRHGPRRAYRIRRSKPSASTAWPVSPEQILGPTISA